MEEFESLAKKKKTCTGYLKFPFGLKSEGVREDRNKFIAMVFFLIPHAYFNAWYIFLRLPTQNRRRVWGTLRSPRLARAWQPVLGPGTEYNRLRGCGLAMCSPSVTLKLPFKSNQWVILTKIQAFSFPINSELTLSKQKLQLEKELFLN